MFLLKAFQGLKVDKDMASPPPPWRTERPLKRPRAAPMAQMTEEEKLNMVSETRMDFRLQFFCWSVGSVVNPYAAYPYASSFLYIELRRL